MNNHKSVAFNIVAIISVALLILSFFVMLEWNTGNLSPIIMSYNTALCFSLSAIGLLGFYINKRSLSLLMALIILPISILTILEFTFNIPTGITTLFYFPFHDIKDLISGEMAPNTAISFIMVAVAYLALATKKEATFTGLLIAGFTSFVITNSALFFFLGYLVSWAPLDVVWSPLTPMAFSTSIGLIILGVGLMFLVWACDSHYHKKIEKLIPLSVFLSAIVADLFLFHALYIQENQHVLAYIVLILGLIAIILLFICYLLIIKITKKSKAMIEIQKKLIHAQLIAKLGSWTWYPSEGKVWCSPEVLAIFDLDTDNNLLDANIFFGYIHPEQQNTFKTALDDLINKKLMAYRETYLLKIKDKEYIIRFEINNENAENKEEVSGILQNITNIRQLEQQLHQAQKMEVIGQLTGGLAHDFNNILMIIQGNLELLTARLQGQETQIIRVESALKAVERGAELTRRLLAFARRQLLQPKLIDIKAVLDDMVKLIKLTLGESIELSVITSDNLKPVWADPAQLENSIMNLIVNARDAITKNGKIILEINNVLLDNPVSIGNYDIEPGEYVKFSISDNGIGISKENLSKVFEPFFTTRQTGKGSGLGLSMVYGFVKQSKGHASIYSELGYGTTVNLYLPVGVNQEPVVQKDNTLTENRIRSGTETILVVEDESDLLRLTVEFLSELGYRVLPATHGVEALRIAESQPDIQLVCTDVVMPQGITGPDLAKKLREIYPTIKVLFVSGYTQNALSQNYIIPEETKILTKPYKMRELAEVIRELLDVPRKDI